MSDKSTSAVFKWALLHVFPLGSGHQWVAWEGITTPQYPEHIRLPEGA